ncbi:MAG: hypothetical protein R6U29_03565 [Desulfosudaceae bacterium]
MKPEGGAASRQTVRLLFCGGCNPGYDRLAVADRLRRWVADSSGYVLSETARPDIVIAVCGCDCACLDLSGLGRARIISITSRAAAEALMEGGGL